MSKPEQIPAATPEQKARLERITAAIDNAESSISVIEHYAAELDSWNLKQAVSAVNRAFDRIYYRARAEAGYTDIPEEYKDILIEVQERTGWYVMRHHADCEDVYFARRGPNDEGRAQITQNRHQISGFAAIETPGVDEDGEEETQCEMLIEFGKTFESVDAAKAAIEAAFAERFK